MQRRSPFQMLVLLMVVLTFSMPFTQHTSVQAVETKPIVRINKGLGSGCLMSGVSTALTSNFPRILYAQQLLGKSQNMLPIMRRTPRQQRRKVLHALSLKDA